MGLRPGEPGRRARRRYGSAFAADANSIINDDADLRNRNICDRTRHETVFETTTGRAREGPVGPAHAHSGGGGPHRAGRDRPDRFAPCGGAVGCPFIKNLQISIAKTIDKNGAWLYIILSR